MFNYYSRYLINKFQTLLLHAIDKGNIEIIKVILNNPKIDINQKLNYGWFEKNALIYAIEKGNLEIIKLLLNDEKLDINQNLIHFYNLEFIFIIWNSFL